MSGQALAAVAEQLRGDGPLTSVEKAQRLLALVRAIRPSSPKQALMTLALGQLLPMVQLPDDPAELDGLLDELGELVALMKSDPAPGGPIPGQLAIAEAGAEATA